MTDSRDPHQSQKASLPSEIFNTMRHLGFNPEVVACIQDAQETLAFDLPESEREAFLHFHDFITNPQPKFITNWRASPHEERWYHALVNGLNGATRNAYMCVLHHFRRLSDLEAEVMGKISKRSYTDALGNSSVGIGNTLVWDFEYQAFVFAYRRCLDYLTRGLAAFFKCDFHSFNGLPKSLKNLKPQTVAKALAAVHDRHAANFAFVMSSGEKRSVRDKIAHYEWVTAGTINLNRHGFILIGGGEALKLTMDHNTARLTETLAERVQMLKACIDEMLTVFVAEARAWEMAQAA